MSSETITRLVTLVGIVGSFASVVSLAALWNDPLRPRWLRNALRALGAWSLVWAVYIFLPFDGAPLIGRVGIRLGLFSPSAQFDSSTAILRQAGEAPSCPALRGRRSVVQFPEPFEGTPTVVTDAPAAEISKITGDQFVYVCDGEGVSSDDPSTLTWVARGKPLYPTEQLRVVPPGAP